MSKLQDVLTGFLQITRCCCVVHQSFDSLYDSYQEEALPIRPQGS